MIKTGASVDELQTIARRIRRHIVQMTHDAQSGHPGGSLSAVEILTALYFGGVLRYAADRPDWPERDRFVMSKGHATPVVYATLAEAGYFDPALLPSFRQLDSILQGHVTRGRPAGVELRLRRGGRERPGRPARAAGRRCRRRRTSRSTRAGPEPW